MHLSASEKQTRMLCVCVKAREKKWGKQKEKLEQKCPCGLIPKYLKAGAGKGATTPCKVTAEKNIFISIQNISTVEWYNVWSRNLYQMTMNSFKVNQLTDKEQANNMKIINTMFCGGARFVKGHTVRSFIL